MKKTILFLIFFFPFNLVFAQNIISIEINLNKIKDNSCKVSLDLRHAETNEKYLFPVSVPGTYEISDYGKYNNTPVAITAGGDTIAVKNARNRFILPSGKIEKLTYRSKQSMNPYGYFNPEDTYFSDSLMLINWNVLAGYFANTTNSYEIKIHKPKEFHGSTSMLKRSVNDTTDIFYANSYTDLIHNPVMYSKADTISFNAHNCKVTVSVYSTSPKYNATCIMNNIKPAINKCLYDSHYAPENYSVLCIADNFKMSSALIALEHPNSTVICLPTLFFDNSILTNTIVHEFCHAIYTPLYIRSALINQFNYVKPECDSHLWFYEGCVEYLSQKKCLQSGVIDTAQFILDLHECWLNMENANLAKTSRSVYSKKGQKYFMDFYTKGCLVAFLLDLELITKSRHDFSLSQLMIKMQDFQKEQGEFPEENFFNLLSQLSGIDLNPFFEKHINSNKPIDFSKNLNRLNYSVETKQIADSSVYTFFIESLLFEHINSTIILKKSIINKQLDIKKLVISNIDHEPISIESTNKLMFPEKEFVELTIVENGKQRNVRVKASSRPFTKYDRIVTRLDNNTLLSDKFFKM